MACGITDAISDKGDIILAAITEYYEIDENATFVDLEILTERLVRKLPKHAEMFKTLVANFNEEVSTENIVSELRTLQRRKIKDELAAAFTAEDNEEIIDTLLTSYSAALNAEDIDKSSTYSSPSAVTVLRERGTESTIKLSPPALNDAIGGGVLRKHHIVVFARPEVGKTAFCGELIAGFLQQGLRVLYTGNEDPPADIIVRLMSRLLGQSTNAVEANPAKADALLPSCNWHNFTFIELTPGTPRELEALIKKHKPDVLLVDQIRNINTTEKNRVLQLETVAQFVRNLGKKYNALTVSVTQAGESAEGKLVLGLTDTDFSNTGIPSTADLMIGIGCNGDYEKRGHRVLAFPKNKINGEHSSILVTLDTRINRIT